MTTTSVKDVGSVMNPGVRAGSAAAKKDDGNFQTVWSSQTEAKQTAERSQTSEKPERAGKPARPGDDLRAKEHSRKNIREDDTAQVQEPQDELSGEDLENAMAVAATAAAGLIEQIADTFGISVESVQELMADMNLQPVDLLQPENLSNLLLEAGGAQDSLSLLTNAELYSDYRMLMEQGRAALEAAGDETGIAPQQLLQAVTEIQAETVVETGGPVVEIDVEEAGDEALVQTAEPEAAEGSEVPEDMRPVRSAQESADDRGAKDTEHNGGRRQGDADGNLMMQTIRSETFHSQAEAVREASSVWDVDTQDIMRQIMDYMKIQVKPGMSDLEMQLHPANLGTLQIHVASRGGALTASFVTQNEAVKAALESQMVQLKESFEAQGVKVEAIEVTVQTHQFEQNLEQGRGRQSQDTSEAKRNRTRRIRLDGADGAEIPDMPQQEDRLTAEMMAANGGTVDYTA